MTSEERRERRYQRRKHRRYMNKLNRSDKLGTVSTVYSFHKLYKAGKACCKNVRWKQSTQNFERHLFSITAVAVVRIANSKWKFSRYNFFWLRERGKFRRIAAPNIRDRQPEKLMTTDILKPVYNSLIYQYNCASQTGKGLHYNFRVLKAKIRQFIKEYEDGYVLILDLHHFFPSASRYEIRKNHEHLLFNNEIVRLCDIFLDNFPATDSLKLTGMPLGVEPSQIEMVSIMNSLDSWMVCQTDVYFMCHYMDDYLCIDPSYERLLTIEHEFTAKLEAMGMSLNHNKTKLQSIYKPFKYCKATFQIRSSGRITMRCNKHSITHFKLRFRRLIMNVAEGKQTLESVNKQFKADLGYYKTYEEHNTILNFNRYYNYLIEKYLGGTDYVQNSCN